MAARAAAHGRNGRPLPRPVRQCGRIAGFSRFQASQQSEAHHVRARRKTADQDHVCDDERGPARGAPRSARRRDSRRPGRLRPDASAVDQRSRGEDRRPFSEHQPLRHAHRAGPIRQGQPAARQGRDQRRPRGVPFVEPDAVAGAREAAQPRREPDPRAPVGTVGADGFRGGQDAPRMRWRCRRVGGPHRLLLRPDGAERRLHQADEHPRPRRGERQRAAAVRGVGGNLALQLPAGPRGRTSRRRARRRQHGGVQAGQRHALHRPAPRRDHERGRHPARRVQLRDGRRQHRGPGTDRQPGRGRRGLHRVARHRLPARQGRRGSADPAPARDRNRRQEPGDHHAVGRPRQGDRRRLPLGVRQPGPEVLGVLAHLRAPRCPQGLRRDARREDEEDQDRQSSRPDRLHGACHQRGRREDRTGRPSSRRGAMAAASWWAASA